MLQIIGLGPFKDLVDWDCETWGLAWDDKAPFYDLCFEMHALDGAPGRHLERLSELTVVTQETYPLRAVVEVVGDYFDCSIAYMIGLAILRRRDFRLLGVELWDEYEFERPNVEYLVGVARGSGLRVEVAEGSALFGRKAERVAFKKAVVYPVRYGYV